MIIQKFGGTSVGSPQRMKELAKITLQSGSNPRIVVLSAVAGTTNKLVQLNSFLQGGQTIQATQHLTDLRAEYDQFVDDLYTTLPFKNKGNQVISNIFELLQSFVNQTFTSEIEKVVLAQGELISTNLYQIYLSSIGVESSLINALDFVRTDNKSEPDLLLIGSLLNPILDKLTHNNYIVTQGYICRNAEGKIDNLQRGGSDYTATIIGAVLEVEEVQIWTDIDGMHNNDPRIVENTTPVRKISYREAAELAYFGAKILHPTCIIPTEIKNVPVRLKYTYVPEAPGTYISKESSGKAVAAIAAKDNITYIRISSDRMMNAYGFLRKVFDVYEKHETSIDMITTSEVSVSMSIDNISKLDNIIADLSQYGRVSFEKNQSIICVVGDKLAEDTTVGPNVLKAFEEIPINMISYGGSINNISILVDSQYKNLGLKNLHRILFSDKVLQNA
jgi:aspartate kinase